MNSEDNVLAEVIQRAILSIETDKDDQWAQTITPIILSNLDSGRVHYFLDKQSDHRPVDYVRRVAEIYEQWHDYLFRVQEERCTELWIPLYEKLQRWAYHYLNRKNFPHNGRDRLRHAIDCATEAATHLLYARFPYDIDFDAWLSVLLQNVIRKHMEREYKEMAKHFLSIDEREEWQAILPALTSASNTDKIGLRFDLLAAIDQLASEARKQIILLHYFEGYSLPQIASKLDKSDNAVYKLHFDALNNLRKIWDDSRYKNE